MPAVFTGFLVILGGIIYQSQSYLDKQREVRFINRIPVFLPNGKILKALSMGHQSLLADYFWIKSVIYFGRRTVDHDNIYYLYKIYDGEKDNIQEFQEHHHDHDGNEGPVNSEAISLFHERDAQYRSQLSVKQQERPQPPDSIPFFDQNAIPRIFEFPGFGMMDYLFPLIDRTTVLDPYFTTPYIFSSVAILAETGEIDWALRLLERGYKHNPEKWELPFYLGYVNWLYKGDGRAMVEYLKDAVQKPDCPEYVDKLLLGFSGRFNRNNILRLYFQSMLESTDNQEVRERIFKILAGLETRTQSRAE